MGHASIEVVLVAGMLDDSGLEMRELQQISTQHSQRRYNSVSYVEPE